MPVWVAQALTAARKVPWRKVLAAIAWLSTRGREYWRRLTPDERREVRDLALKSQGRRSNLSAAEQDRLVALFQKIREGPRRRAGLDTSHRSDGPTQRNRARTVWLAAPAVTVWVAAPPSDQLRKSNSSPPNSCGVGALIVCCDPTITRCLSGAVPEVESTATCGARRAGADLEHRRARDELGRGGGPGAVGVGGHEGEQQVGAPLVVGSDQRPLVGAGEALDRVRVAGRRAVADRQPPAQRRLRQRAVLDVLGRAAEVDLVVHLPAQVRTAVRRSSEPARCCRRRWSSSRCRCRRDRRSPGA